MSWEAQKKRNQDLISDSKHLGDEIISKVVPFCIDIDQQQELTQEEVVSLQALEIDAARVAIQSLASLAKANDLDHLGGGLDLIPALQMTLSFTDYKNVEFTIEHAHTSIGYYGALASRGFLDREVVIDGFRRGLDIAGHVSWVPGGTQLNGGRLGVMIPVAVGQALGKRAKYGDDAWVICHTGDAGWISGQALNGFNAADLHNAPVTFVMHRNGIQLSGTNQEIMDKDPRPVIESLGIEIIETSSMHDPQALYKAYREARSLAQKGRPSLIYPLGGKETLQSFADRFGISDVLSEFAGNHQVDMSKEVWVPGALMSYRDVVSMIESVFLVNNLDGGKCHHDGHMKGRDEAQVLANPMLTFSDEQQAALDKLQSSEPRVVTTKARPNTGTKNLVLSSDAAKNAKLPGVGETVSPRAGVSEAYAAVAKEHPKNVFIVSCDLDPSTKLGKAKDLIPENQKYEVSIEEQLATLLADGLAMSGPEPQLNVVSTFAAFYEGIAREGMELWRYQRNLNGKNEGINACMHMSHVGACTGRDHFSGWSLDWINMAMPYLPYLHRFYAPADARAAFVAVKDLAANYGGHIIGIPRDNLPILTKQGSEEALWNPEDDWQVVTEYRKHEGAKKAVLAMGAPSYLAAEAAEELASSEPVDVFVVNGLPSTAGELEQLISQYEGIVTVEDGLIGNRESGLLGFASLVANLSNVPMQHIGITDPQVAPSDHFHVVWEHFGITNKAIVEAVKSL